MQLPTLVPSRNRLGFVAALLIGAGALAACGDVRNHRAFRETMAPLEADLEVGMTEDEVFALIDERYPAVVVMDYPYSDEYDGDVFDAENVRAGSQIFQLTMDGDPEDTGSSSICFIKILIDRSTDVAVVSDTGSGVACPA